MHKQIMNELRLAFAVEPRGPILIKSGKEAGADPTLLDMNFVRLEHTGLGRSTVYLPGSSLKGTLRSYCEKIARTVGEGAEHDRPFSCNPLGSGTDRRQADYSCGRWVEKQKELSAEGKYAGSCPVCRIFGHTAMAAHLRLADAYPWDPAQPDDLSAYRKANATQQRDGVAIDRISGAVAVGPFSLEVVTKGTFYGDLVLRNFELWQVGLLAIALRDIGRERVPLGFSKSRGLGRVSLSYQALEIAYPGRFETRAKGRDLAGQLYGVSEFLAAETARKYDYRAEPARPLPGGELVEKGEYGRVVVGFRQGEAIEAVLAGCVPAWKSFVEEWRGRGEG